MISPELWSYYNHLGILDIFEQWDSEPFLSVNETTGRGTVQYRHPDGIKQRRLRKDIEGWWHMPFEDILV